MDTSNPPLGELLVRRGVLTPRQVQALLELQAECGRPFGELAESQFGVPPRTVEAAWAQQYMGLDTQIDLAARPADPAVLGTLSRRQAWQFGILPVGVDDRGVLEVATCRQALPRAVRFAWRRLNRPVYLRVASRRQLRTSLMQHYPWRDGRPPAVAWLTGRAGGC